MACAAFILPGTGFAGECGFGPADEDLEIRISSVSAHTLRLTIFSANRAAQSPSDGSLVQEAWDGPVTKLNGEFAERSCESGRPEREDYASPLTFSIAGADDAAIQQIKVDRASGVVSFATGNSPLLGLGEGGPQFDRRGSVDTMKRGQGGYKLQTNGGRVPIPWLIGTAGWAMFFHAPFGTFRFLGARKANFCRRGPEAAYPLDIFFVASREPATIMSEYARLTGNAGDAAAVEFRLHAVAPDAGEPGGNSGGGEDVSRKETAVRRDDLSGHGILSERVEHGKRRVRMELAGVSGSAGNAGGIAQGQFPRGGAHGDFDGQADGEAQDACDVAKYDETEAGCYWDAHRKDFAMGVDGWWPDEGDPLDIASSLVRNECTGKARRLTGRMSGRLRCTATGMRGCNVMPRSCGREMCIRPGRR